MNYISMKAAFALIGTGFRLPKLFGSYIPSNIVNDILRGLPTEKMTKEAEAAAFAAGDTDSLVLGHMKEAFLYARRCCREMLPAEEIYSLCYKALDHAVKNYRPAPGRPRFFGYAKVYIRGEISREWKRKDVVRNSSSNAETLQTETGEEDFSDHDSVHYKPAYVAGYSDSQDPDWSGILTRDLIDKLEPIIKSKLTNQEQTVLALHYSQDLNFSEIGTLLGVSRSASQSTHGTALKKLRCALLRKDKLLSR